MNILMLTNTYSPHVGGVARSVEAFADEYRRCGHRVLVVAPHFEGTPNDECNVVRVPALYDIYGSGFSLALPIPGLLSERVREFQPDIVHSHHPYLLGMAALRIARYRNLPLVFTHHTLYEEYTHYIGADSVGFRQFVAELATTYANLCDEVFAPSESTARLLRERGVITPIEIIPTGTDVESFRRGHGESFRREYGIPPDAFVVGHLGRLAPEKNLGFLAEAVAEFLKGDQTSHFLIVGDGPSADMMKGMLKEAGLGRRVHFTGVVRWPRLADAYHAMDVFAFASRSETQGMVLVEAMAAGVPVVALDGAGVREVVKDEENGRLLEQVSPIGFSAALKWCRRLSPSAMQELRQSARATAEGFSMEHCAARALGRYEALHRKAKSVLDQSTWDHLGALVRAEWRVIKGMAEAARFGRRTGSRQAPLGK